MKNLFILMFTLAAVLGCARVKVEGSKEPIKVDISMRLDVYQHVMKDIDAIEDIVSGEKENSGKAGSSSRIGIQFIREAYAQPELSPEVENAALRRRDRAGELSKWESKGVIGENKMGLLEMRDLAFGSQVGQLINEENSDRMLIYESLAAKNNTSVASIQQIYATRLQNDAPAGTPIEVKGASGYEWKIK